MNATILLSSNTARKAVFLYWNSKYIELRKIQAYLDELFQILNCVF